MKKVTKFLATILCLAAIGISAASFGACAGPTDDDKTPAAIRISGSTSVNEIMEKLAGEYEKDHNVRIYITANGSGTGIADTLAGRNEIGMSSRALKDSEKGLTGKELCRDGIVLAVNKNCPLTQVTNAQIYNLAMNATPIEAEGATIRALAGRESGSGTRDAFDENIFDENGKSISKWAEDEENPKTYNTTAVTTSSTTGLVIEKLNSDAQNKTIGYISMGSYLENTNTIKALKFQAYNEDANANEPFVAPSVETVKDGSYKMQRPFVIVIKQNATLSEAAQGFYDWLWSEQAQAIITANGYVV